MGRRLHPEIQPLTLLYTIFRKKGSPFLNLLLTDGRYSFHIPCFEINMHCLLIGINHKNKTLFWLFKATKIHLLALLGPAFTDRNDRFSYPFINLKVPFLSIASPYGRWGGGLTRSMWHQKVLHCTLTFTSHLLARSKVVKVTLMPLMFYCERW